MRPEVQGHNVSPGLHWKNLRRRGISAEALLRRLNIFAPPVPVEEIAKRLGVSVHRVSSPGWVGAVEVTDVRADIWVAEGDALVRQRFTIAHELGHLILHPDDRLFRDSSFMGDRKEMEANRWAASLLMPASMVIPLARDLGYDVKQMSAMFRVSEQAMKIRGMALGL